MKKRISNLIVVVLLIVSMVCGCSNNANQTSVSTDNNKSSTVVNNNSNEQVNTKHNALDSKLVELYLSTKETQRYNKEHNIFGEYDAKFDSTGRLWIKKVEAGDTIRETHEMFIDYTYNIYENINSSTYYTKKVGNDMNTNMVLEINYLKNGYDLTQEEYEKIQSEFESMKDCYDEFLNNNSLLIIEDKNQEEMDDTFDSNYYEEAEDLIIEKKMNKEYFWVILKEVATPKNNHFVEIMGENFWEEECLSDKFKETYDIKNGILGISDTDSIQDISITNFDFDNQMIDLRVEFSDRTSKEYVVKWKVNNNLELDEVSVSEKNNAIRQGRKIGADETMPIFETVPDNKVSIIENLASRINEIKLVKEYSRDTNIDKMDTVMFGSYPQSDITGNTKEPIEWIVLEKNDNDALLLSKYILDCKPYKDRKSTSGNTIKKWLNSEFYNNAFSRDEQNIILTNVSDKGNSDVFLLTVDDLEDYFNIKNSSRSFINECLATCGTEYAKSIDNNGEKLNIRNSDIEKNLNGNSKWWTQSRGDSADKVVTVSGDGTYLYDGTSKISNIIGVRPAIWITLKKH